MAKVVCMASFLTGSYDDLSFSDRAEALRLARLAAQRQAADERAQDARLGRRVWRSPEGIADTRVAALAKDDPRRVAYLSELRGARG